jgi:hypothetical protein
MGAENELPVGAHNEGGCIVRRLGDAKVRQRVYKANQPKDRAIIRRLVLRHTDGPTKHPASLGLAAYGKGMPEAANPFNQSTDFETWLDWFAGWHYARRAAGNHIEGDCI